MKFTRKNYLVINKYVLHNIRLLLEQLEHVTEAMLFPNCSVIIRNINATNNLEQV